ncbi:MAG: hypothetical protein K8L97_07115 [Anaerolineae bacterium]|nr:hypothetical protein [Anaerolineae bacterium]
MPAKSGGGGGAVAKIGLAANGGTAFSKSIDQPLLCHKCRQCRQCQSWILGHLRHLAISQYKAASIQDTGFWAGKGDSLVNHLVRFGAGWR